MIQRRRIEHSRGTHTFRSSFLAISSYIFFVLLFFFSGFYVGNRTRPLSQSPSNEGQQALDSLKALIASQENTITRLQSLIQNLENELQTIKSTLNNPNAHSAQTPTSKEQGKDLSEKPKFPISIQILNGCGVEGITQKMARFLKEYDVKISGTGNYKSFKVKNSFIISQKSVPDDLKKLASFLGIPTKRIYRKKVRSRSDYILVLGKDYSSLKPFKK